MNYCPDCGNRVEQIIPEGDDKVRSVCRTCNTIHYENPRMVAGTVPEWEGKILLCKRSINPAKGKWTLPAGYLENGETVADCALRETREEACAFITAMHPYAMIDLPFINQVYFMFLGQLVNGSFKPGPESLETKLFSLDEIPWEEIAFGSIRTVLEKYSRDREASAFPFEVLEYSPSPKGE